MTSPYFFLFLVVSVCAQIEHNDSEEGTIPNSGQDLSSYMNETTEARPSKCKEILKGFVDESVNTVS